MECALFAENGVRDCEEMLAQLVMSFLLERTTKNRFSTLAGTRLLDSACGSSGVVGGQCLRRRQRTGL